LDAQLPFIELSFQDKHNLKFLVDTGAEGSFISPKYVTDREKINLEIPISITTVLQEPPIRQITILPIFEKINDQRKFPFLLFDFNQFFDGLIGMNILTELPATIDSSQLTFTTPTVKMPLRISPNRSSEIFEIEEESKALIKISVSVKEGPFLCDNIQLEQDIFITAGIYMACNNFGLIEINNFSTKPKKFYLDSIRGRQIQGRRFRSYQCITK